MDYLPPKIAIVGAGPGGLTLANILQRNQVPFVVYELDSSPHDRNQGGSLDLHPQDGQLALREAGLWDQFVEHARPESDVMKILQLDGHVCWDENGPDARSVPEEAKFDHRPEIDREVLREILLAPLAPKGLQWGKKLVKAVPSQARSDAFDLHFADGSVEKDVDLVVGADGAWSKVRGLLTDTKPHYSGISTVDLRALHSDEKHEWMSEYVGRGSCFAFGEGRAVQSQRIGDGCIRTYASLRVPESFIEDCGIDWTEPETARREYVEKYFGDCGEELKRLLLESEDDMMPRALYMLPVGFRWESRPGVTLLGDAAHLMTPFAGVGVNVAMADALHLGRAIVGHCKGKGASSDGKSSLATAVESYESGLFPRGERFAQKTFVNMGKHFSATGSEDMARRLRAEFGTPTT